MRIKNIIVAVLCMAFPLASMAQKTNKEGESNTENKNSYARQYTSVNPLVYEDVWDLEPYAFVNSDGHPDGYNVELVKIMLDKLSIPFVIKLKHTPQNFEDLQSGKADLTIGMKAFYHDQYGEYSNNVLALFTHSLASPRNSDVKVKEFADLKNLKVYVHEGSYSHNMMVKEGMGANVIPMKDMKTALQKVNESGKGAVLWNTMNVSTLINKYKLSNVRMTSVNMKYGEYHFMSNDTVLLFKLDSLYDEMTSSEEFLNLRQKWFYPNAQLSNSKAWFWYVIYTLVVMALFVTIYNIYYHYMEKRVRRDNARQSTQLQLLLKSGNYRIWTYDVAEKKFRAVSIEGEARDEYNEKAFSVFYDSYDFMEMMETIERVACGASESESLSVRCHDPKNMGKTFYFDLNISVLHEQYGEPTLLLGVQTDKTGERMKYVNTRDSLLRFRTMFDTAMAQMAFYDKNGIMTDINNSACETFGILDKEGFLKSKMHISQVPVFHHMKEQIIDELWVSSIVDFDDLRRKGQLSDFWTRKGVVYYEFTIMPIYDDNGELVCIVSAGRDITEMAMQMNRERRRSKRIEAASAEMKRYTENINTALEVSNTLLANYNIETKTMEVTYDMHKPKLKLSQLQCVHMIDPSQTRKAANIMLRMDRTKIGKFKIRLKTRERDKDRKNVYYELNAVPMKADNGKVSHYFCLCRNISKLVETEKRLHEESMKAQEAEKVKNSFLMNMSYEIRTPLNTVVGFAELFNAPHDREDEKTFIEQIKKNSDLLLKLVNNILLLSRIDAKMLELNPQPTDFGEFFKAQCLMGVSRGVNPGVETMFETRAEPLILEIDTAQTGHIIENLVMLSSQFTKHGYIKTRYEYHNSMVTFSIEDTGVGIDKASVNRIMSRTYEGVKGDYNVELEITICNELAVLMGGHMEIQSAVGRGTVVWVSLPCKNLLEELENNAENGII